MKVEPASSISQTWVIGGSVVVWPLLVLVGVVDEGVGVSEEDVGDVAVLSGVVLDALMPALDSAVAGGVACGVTAGGWTAVVLDLAPAPLSDGSRGTSWPTAKEALGAGPIAAPTATPIASIAAASAAVTRGEGARRGDFGFSGMLFIEWS